MVTSFWSGPVTGTGTGVRLAEAEAEADGDGDGDAEADAEGETGGAEVLLAVPVGPAVSSPPSSKAQPVNVSTPTAHTAAALAAVDLANMTSLPRVDR
ncbi:hypothetical protein ABZ464_30540 [Streptomyces sp. NPDC005820]|uniref:hypothetical protein n=1 Tax=Streptomyces sp. NPDC005820 TaxID=3157069 RepID=UPI00340D55B4